MPAGRNLEVSVTTMRLPAVAGLFYPEEADALRAAVLAHMGQATVPDVPEPPPKALIVPHAGYRYSGPVAGTAYRHVVPLRGQVRRVVLLGPAHYVPLLGMAAPSVDALQTPLGALPVDRAAVESVLDLPQVVVWDQAHAVEHSLEVQLPFLMEALGAVSVVPMVVGEAPPHVVAEVLERLWDGPETLVVVSSDLSHFHSSDVARRLDAQTAAAIERLDCAGLREGSACGWRAVCGLLLASARHGLRCRTVDLRNSGDTAGRTDSVVGYGAFVFTD
jgi:AmmeMemoRadiSam system protein B